MRQCMSKADMAYFLDVTGLTATNVNDLFLVVHASVGDIYWLWNGLAYCYGLGVMS